MLKPICSDKLLASLFSFLFVENLHPKYIVASVQFSLNETLKGSLTKDKFFYIVRYFEAMVGNPETVWT